MKYTAKKKLPYPVCGHLPSNIIDEMKEETRQSKKDKLEHGFVICSSAEHLEQMDNKNTAASTKCIGTDCKISVTMDEVRKSCSPDKKDIAYFHTHPMRDISLPSFDDIVSMHALEHKFMCIGSKTEIRCFSQNVPSPRAFMEIPSKEYEKFRKTWKKDAEDCVIKID